MVKNVENVALKGSWDTHALPIQAETENITPANRNETPSSSIELSHDEVLQRAKAGWTTRNTYAGEDDKKAELIAKERLARIQGSATGVSISQGFISRMETEIESQIEMIRFDLQQNAQATDTAQMEIETIEENLESVQAQRNLEARRLILEAEEAAAADAELEVAEQEHEAALQALKNADSYGGLDQAQAAAQELSRTGTAVEIHQEICDEEQAEVDAARTRLEATQGHIDGFEARLSELRAQVTELGDQAVELAAELEEYEAFHDYLTSEEVAERVARGEMTLEDLQSHGMPDEVSRRVMGETVEVSRSYDLSDGRDLWVDMRRGLGEAANNFFESTGLSKFASNFGLAAAETAETPETPINPDTPTIETVKTAEIPAQSPPAGTSLG